MLAGIRRLWRPGTKSTGQGERHGKEAADFRTEMEVAAPSDPDMASLLSHWRVAKASREMPMRRDISLSRIRAVLPRLYILDVVDQTFRVRMQGTEVDRWLGSERTGQTLAECGYGKKPAIAYSICAMRQRPVVTVGSVRWPRQHLFLSYEKLVLPLGDEDGIVVQLLCAMNIQ